MQQLTISISGMSCGGCVSAVREALGALAGTRVEEVTVGSATVSYDVSRTSAAAIAQAVRDAGYEPVADGSQAIAAAAGGSCCGGGGGGGSCCG